MCVSSGATDKSTPGCSKLTFSCEKRFMRKSELEKKAEERCRKLAAYDDLEYTVDSWSSTSKTKEKAKVTLKVRTELGRDTGCREAARGS